VLEKAAPLLPTLKPDLPKTIVVNGGGNFLIGGPEGDNGLSGKKLLMDYYGPRVPTGGSALFGKDAFKPDRVNAVKARELALAEMRARNAKEVTVTLVYFPGMMEGEMTRIEVNP
jgi:S-adenosylmethionine synthetase